MTDRRCGTCAFFVEWYPSNSDADAHGVCTHVAPIVCTATNREVNKWRHGVRCTCWKNNNAGQVVRVGIVEEYG